MRWCCARVWAADEAAGVLRRTIAVGASKHPAVLEPVRVLADQGARGLSVLVLDDGRVDLNRLDEILLLSIMLANNSTGVRTPSMLLTGIARDRGALIQTTPGAGTVRTIAKADEV